MKTNLSKEHIKRGCELISGYQPDGDIFKESNDPCYEAMYRDFLQLVIEGINREYEDACIEQLEQCIEATIAQSHYGAIERVYYYSDMKPAEAKEKLIAYVLDNIKGENK